MGRRYGHPIAVTVGDGHPHSHPLPTAFSWRGRRYLVRVIGTWRLRAKWWEPTQATDRLYYRVTTANHQVFDLYHDVLADTWVLDVCHD